MTDTTDPSEARDLLDAVLAHDRADVPAVTQLRHLAHTDGSHHTPRPEPGVPDWLPTWRQQLDDHRRQLIDDLADRQDRQAAAPQELHDLEPTLNGARAAWEPYARPIQDLEHELDTVLRPPKWEANHHAGTAGIGHRRSAQRSAIDADRAVQQAEAAIVGIHAEGAPQKEHLDCLRIREGELRALTTGPDRLDAHLRQQIAEHDQILDATDTYTAWLTGRPTPSARLAHAVETLTTVARHAPAFGTDANSVDQTRWYQLLDLAPDHLTDRLVQQRSVDGLEFHR